MSISYRKRFKNWITAILGAVFLYLLGFSLRWNKAALAEAKRLLDDEKQFILAFWHGRQLTLPYLYKGLLSKPRRILHILISLHSDGRLIARIVKLFDIHSVNGSSTRGGRAAFNNLLKVLRENGNVGMAPDGPRGPIHVCKFGVVALAQQSGVKIVPIAFSSKSKWRVNSWDRMFVPVPFSKATLLIGEKISVLPGEDLDTAKKKVEDALNELCSKADNTWG